MTEPTMRSVDQILDGADAFFQGTDALHRTVSRVSERLDSEGIDYALVGGLALNLHGYVRMTSDINLLMTPASLERFHERLVGRGYVPLFAGARKSFRDTETNIILEILSTGDFPGDGKHKAVRFGDPAEVSESKGDLRVIRLDKLIEIKLASGLSASHRLRDLADVQDLISILNLPAGFADKLDPSVSEEYSRLWNAVNNARDQSE